MSPVLLTASAGVVRTSHSNPNDRHCNDCGSLMRFESGYPRNRPEWRCITRGCPQSVARPAPVNTSFAVVEGV